MENRPQSSQLPGVPNSLIAVVQQRMTTDAGGNHHDFLHVLRVVRLGARLAKAESADAHIVALACLLHDIADHKFHNGDRDIGPRIANELMEQHGIEANVRSTVCNIITRVSFSGSGGTKNMESFFIEGQCVQDADRLDSIGAIGVARTFSYAGSMNRSLLETIDHFDEKLLRLQGLLNTATARQIGQKRHAVLEQFKKEFLEEWNAHDAE